VTDEPRTGEAYSAAGKRIVLLIFLLSGFAGLVYEVVWSRQLVLVFGNTTQAISAILTGFFGGMAIGSVVGGRLADRVRRPLRMYAILEVLVVIAVLLTPVTFRGLHEVYRGAFGSLEENPALLALVRFGLAILALGPATILMGATLPTLSRYLVRDHTRLGEEFGGLYTANTFGAIFGALISGIFLIELIGLSATLLVGAACSGTAGLAALLLSMRSQKLKQQEEPGTSPDESAAATAGAATKATPAVAKAAGSMAASAASPATGSRASKASRPVAEAKTIAISRPKLALAVAFVSGLTSLGYQNLWTRILSSGTGSSTYIFTSILVVFLAGIAFGAFIFSRYLSRTRNPVALLGVAEIALAVVVLGALGIETKYFGDLMFQIELVLVVAPATLVMGIVFPMSSMLVADSDDRVGTSAGMLLGANTLGAICGTFIVPFYLMPILTSPRSVVLIAAINAVTGLVLLWQARPLGLTVRRAGSAFGGLVAICAVVLMAVPNALVVDPSISDLNRSNATIFAQGEDEIASVQAASIPGARFQDRLYVGGYSMTGLTAVTRLMPELALMVRPQSKTICVVAFGMGSSYRSALMAGLKADAVELDPSVPGMFRYFYPDADQVMANPNGHVIVADGRNHVELTSKTYDLIMSDPPPPMNTSGTAVLFSQEMYQASKARLNKGGVMLQWVPYNMTVDEFRSHARTFKSVFPHVTLVFSPMNPSNGVLMLGSDDPIDLTTAGMQSVLTKPGIVEDLSSAVDSPPGVKTADQWQQLILSNVWLSDSGVDKFGATGQLVTDDRPYTEFDLLRRRFGPKSPSMGKETLLAATPK
jgi:spermidine synthase